MNSLEYGQVLKADMGEDVSTALSYKMYLEPKRGTKLDVVATLGTSTVTEDGVTYTANHYVEYVIAEGDLSYVGHWQRKGIAIYGSSEIHGNYQRFTVLG